jgi:hypothetical protein
VLVLIVAVSLWVAAPAPAAACDLPLVAYTFTGTAVAVEGAVVTYEVDGVLQGTPEVTAIPPNPGDRVGVEYDPAVDAALIELGTKYTVATLATGANGERAVSQVRSRKTRGCGHEELTTYADGSSIVAGGSRWFATTTSLAAAALAVGAVVLVRRRRTRSPEPNMTAS